MPRLVSVWPAHSSRARMALHLVSAAPRESRIKSHIKEVPVKIPAEDQAFIEEAARFFVNPGVVAKSLSWIGEPIERLQKRLPVKAQEKISQATKTAVEKALVAAVTTLPNELPAVSNPAADSVRSGWLHKGTTGVVGALGGFFGLAALPLELPVTTVLILRGILDQARVYGHDINDIETRLEGLMVFTMGTSSPQDDATETGYFAARISLANTIRLAASSLAGTSAKQFLEILEKGTVPALVRLTAQVAKAFEIRVTQKLASEVVPFLGAVGGSAMNFAFTDFYCTAAKYHFGVRALEKQYGIEPVQALLKKHMKA